jgi:site-specific recombinase XerD
LYLLQLAQQYRQITTTEIYARVSDDSLKRAVAAAKWHPRRVGASSGRHLGRLH